MIKSNEESIILFNLKFFGGQMTDLLAIVTQQQQQASNQANQVCAVVTPNPEQVILTRNLPEFEKSLQSADIRIPDGIGLVYASKLFSIRYGTASISKRVTGRAVVEELLAYAVTKPLNVLVIGGRDLGSESQDKLRPIRISSKQTLTSDRWYWTEGYRDVSRPLAAEEIALRQLLDRIKPDLVFAAFGAPEQELWLQSHRELLSGANVKVAMAVGGAFDVLCGNLRRPPAWTEFLGLEWLFRLWQEPWRWRRQVRLIQFGLLVILGLFSKQIAGLRQVE